MWRAFFLAIGVTLCLVGVECMVLDHAVLASSGQGERPAAPPLDYGGYGFAVDPPRSTVAESKTIEPPEWAPWSLLSCGAIVLLYSITRRGRGE